MSMKGNTLLLSNCVKFNLKYNVNNVDVGIHIYYKCICLCMYDTLKSISHLSLTK